MRSESQQTEIFSPQYALQRLSDKNHVQIIAKDSRIAISVNGESIALVLDPHPLQGSNVSLTVCNNGSTQAEARFDNLKIWDISDLPSPPTVIATINTPVASIQLDQIIFQEHFDDPQYDGSLPPSLTPNHLQEQLPIQRNGVLQFLPTQENDTAVIINVQMKPEQLRLFQARIKVASPWFTATSLGGMSIYLGNQTTKDKVTMACTPYNVQVSCSVGVDPESTVPSYRSTPLRVQSDVWYVVRMELANPETLEWRFYLNDTRIGQYTVPPDAVSRFKAGQMGFSFFRLPQPNSAPVVYVDDILIVGR